MGGLRESTATSATTLNTVEPLRRTTLNRVFAAVYTCAIFTLLYHHAQTLLFQSKTLLSFSISLSLLVADMVLAFMWTASQSFRMRPVHRREYPENLKKVTKRDEFPGLDVFICTADPYKEPPMSVVNTALSVMAYDYPTEKISVYISDDGGSAFTLFAFMEAAKFASHWLPFCRKKDVMERNPDAYFASNHSWNSETEKIKVETVDHVFLLCPWSWGLWKVCMGLWSVQSCVSKNVKEWFVGWKSFCPKANAKRVWETLFFALVWTIWETRNQVVFKRKPADFVAMTDLVRFRVAWWFKVHGKWVTDPITVMV